MGNTYKKLYSKSRCTGSGLMQKTEKISQASVIVCFILVIIIKYCKQMKHRDIGSSQLSSMLQTPSKSFRHNSLPRGDVGSD
jgi:hypothetical protein